MRACRSITRFLFLVAFYYSLFASDILRAGISDQSNQLFAKSLELALKNKFVDYSLIERIETIYHSTTEPDERVVSAYLLTYAPVSLLDESKKSLISFIISNNLSERLLGSESMVRLFRLRADSYYDDGKFIEAIADYEQIRRRDNSHLYQYAVLKTGWALLNLNQSGKAFSLWMQELKKNTAHEKGQANLLYHGIGQAFAENLKRSPKDIYELGSLFLDGEAMAAVISGIRDGIQTFKKDRDYVDLGLAAAGLPWNEQLLKTCFESGDHAKDSCRLFYLVAQKQTSLPYVPFGSKAAQCVGWLLVTNQQHGEFADVISRVLPLLDLAGNNRTVRFAYYDHIKSRAKACEEGIDWLFDRAIDDRSHIPATPISDNCAEQFTNRQQAIASVFLSRLRAAAAQSRLLQSRTDPLVYFIVKMSSVTKFREALSDELQQNIPIYASTLLPRLVAESLFKNMQTNEAYTLNSKYPSQQDWNGIWGTILKAHVIRLIDKTAYDEAHLVLEKFAPLGARNIPNHEVNQLWTRLLYQDKHEHPQWLKASLHLLFTPGTLAEQPELAPLLYELAVYHKDWDSIWSNLNDPNKRYRLKPHFRQAILSQLFSAIAEARFEPPPAKFTNSELGFVSSIAQAARERDVDGILENSPVGESMLSKDISYLRKLEQRCDKQFALVQKLAAPFPRSDYGLHFSLVKSAPSRVASGANTSCCLRHMNCCRTFAQKHMMRS